MPHVAMIDRGDHWHVIGDYSGSPRHAAMREDEWKTEFLSSQYEEMRRSHPGIVAGITPKGAGKWKKDWSGPYVAKP